MMNSSRPKHPPKKRRIDGDPPDPRPGPSQATVAFVAMRKKPTYIRRAPSPETLKAFLDSDDPTEEDMATNDSSTVQESSPNFVKASCIVRNESRSASDCDDPNRPSTSKSSCCDDTATTRPRRQLVDSFTPRGKRKAKTPSKNSFKITRFFKYTDERKSRTSDAAATTKKKSRVVFKDPHLSVTFSWSQNWDKKDEQFLDSITDNEHLYNHQSYYGLVEKSEDTGGEDYFKRLPTHVIESILCQVPMLDLMSCRLVCSRWLDIIDNSKFMEWKKIYYKYKTASSSYGEAYQSKMQTLVDQHDYKTVEDCIPTIIKFMGKNFNRIPCSDMYDLLIQNHHGELADHVLLERFHEWNGKDSRVWCQFAIAVIICETVWDILNVYKSLFTSKSSCLRTDINDALYCIATFLFHFRSVSKINCGLHYRVYHALYLIENSIPFCQREKIQRPNIPGQQSIDSYRKNENCPLTYEQIRILNHTFDMHQKIRILAMAGTGKTTTLIHLAQLYPQIRFLCLVFNKSVNEEAKSKFPPNVTCKTAHALAFGAVGKFYRQKLTTTIRPHDLVELVQFNVERIPNYVYENLVLMTINNFTLSDAPTMTLAHVPPQDLARTILSRLNRDRILRDAREIWKKMIDETSPLRITHDTYLKLYHLKKPKLNKYQCIMVDEAQDCNPVILDIVLSQTVPVLFVGDPHQQIYKFRGAENALQQIKATHTYHLTKSFRFGPQVSYVASCVLDILMDERSNTIVGNTSDSNLCGKISGQYAIIARTNVVLFKEALRVIITKNLKPHEPTVVDAAFAGGISSYGFDQILDIYTLKYRPKVPRLPQDKFISRFKTYSELISYAKFCDDKDLISKVEIVNEYGEAVFKIIAALNKKCSSPIGVANVIFSTAHKSKGLEFDTVALTDDYPFSAGPGFLDVASARDEANVLYVAMTRAKKCLLMPEKLTKVLYQAHEKFEYPVSSQALLKSSPELKCVVCSNSFVPHTVLVMLRRKTVLSSGRSVSEGPLCTKCGSDPYMRPDVHLNNIVMYLDPTKDNCHRLMASVAGPLPHDPPIVHDTFNGFNNADRVFVINLNIH